MAEKITFNKIRFVFGFGDDERPFVSLGIRNCRQIIVRCAVIGGRNGISEYYMYDATNVRLRELTLGYSFPASILSKTKFIKGLDLTLVARNLFFLYKDAPFDPDATLSVGNTLQGVDVFGMPTTRNIGFNVKFTF